MKSQNVSTGNDLRFHLNVKYPDKNISSKQHSDTLSSFKTAFLSLLGEDSVLDNSDSPSGLVGFPGGASGKEPVCQCRRHKRLGFEPHVGNIPWRRAWRLPPVFLPGEYHGQRSLGLHRVRCDWSDLAHVHRLIKKLLSWVLLLSCVRFFATPWTAARQTSLSITNSRSLLKLMSVESMMPSNHLILCCPLLLLPSIFPASGKKLLAQEN